MVSEMSNCRSDEPNLTFAFAYIKMMHNDAIMVDNDEESIC
jgi:hypothetical protein